MVCVVGDVESTGGCGLGVSPTGYADGDILIFEDMNDNHKYDDGRDDIYELGGAGSGEVPEGACMWVQDGCPSGWDREIDPSSKAFSKTVTDGDNLFIGLKLAFSNATNALACCKTQFTHSMNDVTEVAYGCGGSGPPAVPDVPGDGCTTDWNCGGSGVQGKLWRCEKDPITYYWCCPSE